MDSRSSTRRRASASLLWTWRDSASSETRQISPMKSELFCLGAQKTIETQGSYVLSLCAPWSPHCFKIVLELLSNTKALKFRSASFSSRTYHYWGAARLLCMFSEVTSSSSTPEGTPTRGSYALIGAFHEAYVWTSWISPRHSDHHLIRT